MNELTNHPEEFLSQIHIIRGQRIMMDADLAAIYGTETKYVKRAVKRNPDRFPTDFIFQLTKDEFENLRRQSGTSKWSGSRYLPYAFTEHGAVMLATVLNTPLACIAMLLSFYRSAGSSL